MPSLEEIRNRYRRKPGEINPEEEVTEAMANQLDVEELAAERARKKRKRKREEVKGGDSNSNIASRGLIEWGNKIKGRVTFTRNNDVLFQFGGKKGQLLSKIDEEKYLRWLLKDLPLNTEDNKRFSELVSERIRELEF